jgi:hypothetical protein
MTDSEISLEWVNSHKTQFELFGVPSEELSRDELLATIGWLNNQLQWERENHNKSASNAESVAWLYKGEPWFDGSRWHDKYEVTTDERLAKWKDKDALPLYDAPWLTEEEREAMAFAARKLRELANQQYRNGDEATATDTSREADFVDGILARSTPKAKGASND